MRIGDSIKTLIVEPTRVDKFILHSKTQFSAVFPANLSVSAK
jgi:hypothetical protein